MLPKTDINSSLDCLGNKNDTRTYCTPGCVCPPGFLESSSGHCVQTSQCECKSFQGSHDSDHDFDHDFDRDFNPGQSWRIGCTKCQCTNGKITCLPTPGCTDSDGDGIPDIFDEDFDDKNCKFTNWTDWTVCNVTTCNSVSSRRFRFRGLVPGTCSSKDRSGLVEEGRCVFDSGLQGF